MHDLKRPWSVHLGFYIAERSSYRPWIRSCEFNARRGSRLRSRLSSEKTRLEAHPRLVRISKAERASLHPAAVYADLRGNVGLAGCADV